MTNKKKISASEKILEKKEKRDENKEKQEEEKMEIDLNDSLIDNKSLSEGKK